MMLLTCSLMQWTTDCEKALDRGDKKGLKSLKKKQVHTGYSCAGSSNGGVVISYTRVFSC